MTTPPEDVDALFGLPSLPTASDADAAAAAAAADADAAEAALAAEMASAMDLGGVADDAPDSRTALRLEVSWPARMRLPDGRVIDLRVRNISESGVGLVSDRDIPAYTVVGFEMDVPHPEGGDVVTHIEGTIKTAYTVAHGSEILCGGTWQSPPAGLDIVNRWIDRLRAERLGGA